MSAEYEDFVALGDLDSRQRSLLVKSALVNQGEVLSIFLGEFSAIARLLTAQSYDGQIGLFGLNICVYSREC